MESTASRIGDRSVAPLSVVILAFCIPALAPRFATAQPVQKPLNEGAEQARRSQRETPAVRVFRECSPAVVNLSTTKMVTVQRQFGMGLFDDIFDMPELRQPRQYKAQSVGSGFVIHADGYVVTNAHVVDRAAECTVTFSDGTVLNAEEVAIDRRHDLAVLKVKARKPLPYLKLGRSNDLMAGETVVAIGNPLGLQHTVTTGVVSALERTLDFDEAHSYTGLIQTDASINPGNSGGPLLNIFGELIGVNTAIRGDAQNIGFAIPVDRLTELLPQMLDIERVRKVRFGILFDGAPVEPGTRGVRVARVMPETPAAEARIGEGDILMRIDNQPTTDFMQAFSLLERTPVGQSMKLDFVSADGRKKSVEVLLTAIPRLDGSQLVERFFGLSLRAMDAADLRHAGVSRPIGLVVRGVEPGTEAARQQLQAGDIVTKFGGIAVTDMEALAHLAGQVERGDHIPFQILRIGREAIVRFELALKAN
ncbi:MAG TPA: trypsin-like peptidase domain-containing protein [Phycisphaerae bacterium]|nr:trypsin-like peptidase domain-containing protein [Phycisphaerae bacterium]